MNIIEIKIDKKKYIDLLLLADEQENMIDLYLERGIMFVLDDNGIKTVCVVTNEGNGVLEIKNLATHPDFQNKGYAKKMIEFIENNYKNQFNTLQVGTGKDTFNVSFYEKRGFKKSHIIKNFFIDNYDHPIFENGVRLVDMVYLKKSI